MNANISHVGIFLFFAELLSFDVKTHNWSVAMTVLEQH